MKKPRKRTIIIFLVLLLLLVPLSLCKCLPNTPDMVKPIAQCITINQNGTFTAYFSYENKAGKDVIISPGKNNSISTGTLEDPLPSTFFTGPRQVLSASPVQVTAPVKETITWNIGKKKAFLNASSQECPSVKLPRNGSAQPARPTLSISDKIYEKKVTDPAANLIPGASQQRALVLSRTSPAATDSLLLKVATNRSNYLSENAEYGLQVKVDRCSEPWIEHITSNETSYTCPKLTSLLYKGSLKEATEGVNLGVNEDLNAGKSLYLRWTWTLPYSSPNESKGLSLSVVKLFTYKADKTTKIYVSWEPSGQENIYNLWRNSTLIYTGTYPAYLDQPPSASLVNIYYIEALDKQGNSSGKSFLTSINTPQQEALD